MDRSNVNARDRTFSSRHENSRLAKLEATVQDPMERCRQTPHAAGRDASYNIHYSIYGQRHPYLSQIVGAWEGGREFGLQWQRNQHDDWREAKARARRSTGNRNDFQRAVVSAILYLPMRVTGAAARTALPIKNLGQQANRPPAHEAQMAQTRQYMDLHQRDENLDW